MMTRVRFLVSIYSRQFGLLNSALMSGIGVLIVTYFVLHGPFLVKEVSLAQELKRVKTEVENTRANLKAAPPSKEFEKFSRFKDLLSDKRFLEQEIKRVLTIAQQDGVALRSGEYKRQEGLKGVYSVYSMKFPVRGTYVQIRRFVEHSLTLMPYASLDELSFKRDNVGQQSLEARVTFSLYVGDFEADSSKGKFE